MVAEDELPLFDTVPGGDEPEPDPAPADPAPEESPP